MTGFLIKRVLQAVFVIVAVTLLVSYAVRLTGDPALLLSQGSGSVTEQDLANIRQALGLNRPFHFFKGLEQRDHPPPGTLSVRSARSASGCSGRG